MAKRLFSEKLIHISNIHEEMKLIEGSNTDYITPTAKVYKDYGGGYFYPKKPYQNKNNLYLYVGITFSDGKNRSRRLHRLLAQSYIPNPDPLVLKDVGHKDNIKWHCELDNLYWTTNKDNTQKAVDDKLLKNASSEHDSQSMYVKVLDKNTKTILGVYGSISQCERCIKNSSKSFIAKVCNKENYVPRNKKFIYQFSNKDEYEFYSNLQNVLLEDNLANKKPKVFRMTNLTLGYDKILDNQTLAEKITGIKQSVISRLIKENNSLNGWSFQFLDEKEYSESSAFKNFLDTIDDISIQNINTGDILHFDCKKDMKDYFGLKGNSESEYVTKGHTIMHEWKVLN